MSTVSNYTYTYACDNHSFVIFDNEPHSTLRVKIIFILLINTIEKNRNLR